MAGHTVAWVCWNSSRLNTFMLIECGSFLISGGFVIHPGRVSFLGRWQSDSLAAAWCKLHCCSLRSLVGFLKDVPNPVQQMPEKRGTRHRLAPLQTSSEDEIL